MKTGGLREMLRMIHAARAHGMGVMLGSMVEIEPRAVGRGPARAARRLRSTSTGTGCSRAIRSSARPASAARSTLVATGRASESSARVSRVSPRLRRLPSPRCSRPARCACSRSQRRRGDRSPARLAALPGWIVICVVVREPVAADAVGRGHGEHGVERADLATLRCCGARPPRCGSCALSTLVARAVRAAQAAGCARPSTPRRARSRCGSRRSRSCCSAARPAGSSTRGRCRHGEMRRSRLVAARCWRCSPSTWWSTARWWRSAVAWSTERPYLRVLREDWFYAERLLDDAAAFLLSPLMVISFEAIGYVGRRAVLRAAADDSTSRTAATSSCARPSSHAHPHRAHGRQGRDGGGDRPRAAQPS